MLSAMQHSWHHGWMRKILLSMIVLFLAGCATGINPDKYNPDEATRQDFKLCHGYSCTYKSAAGFTKTEWEKVRSIFGKDGAKDAASERSKIGQAIAMMEGFSGAKTGTSGDLPMAGAFKENNYQMDCIDETINTTHYVGFLQQDGLLKYHEITDPTHRGYFIDGRWPHNTAVIREKDSGMLFVVDSFYRGNGEEPYILPRQDWLAGWKPPGANQ